MEEPLIIRPLDKRQLTRVANVLRCAGMRKTATVHARIDAETKKRSEEILHALGMTPTDAVRLLYRQIAIRKEFPLELRVPNETTLATFAKTDRGEEIESFETLDDLMGSWEDE